MLLLIYSQFTKVFWLLAYKYNTTNEFFIYRPILLMYELTA